MKKSQYIIIAVIIAAVGIVAAVRLFTGEDVWICQNGQWVQHGHPSASMPITGCGANNQVVVVPTSTEKIKEGLVITSPLANALVSSPLRVAGYVNGGGWAPFEGQAGVVELFETSPNGMDFHPIGERAILTIKGDWMKFPAYFDTILTVSDLDMSKFHVLVFTNENASGLPENGREYRLPITFATGTMNVKVYFNNSKSDPNLLDCAKVYAVNRTVLKTQAVAMAALEQLLNGPTVEEKADGYIGNINPGVKVNSLVIKDGIAKVDFDETLEKAVGGSCRVTSIRSQITETLKQFATVKNVVISVNGKTEDILQP